MKHNPLKPTTSFTLNSIKYELLFDFESVALAEDLSDRPLLTGLRQRDYQSPTISLVRIMLFACLQPNHPEVTLHMAKEFVTQKNYREIWTAVINAWAEGLADPDKDEAGDVPLAVDQS